MELAPLVQEMLAEMEKHENLPRLIRRSPELGSRLICGRYEQRKGFDKANSNVDLCKASILSSSFLCETCGYEICVLCHNEQGARMDTTCTSWTEVCFFS